MPIEDYEIKDVLAQSERTLVRRARRRSDGADVVLKSLTREYPSARDVGQFEFEYRILRKLQMPGVIRGLALEREGDRLSIVLEDFGGERLPSCASGKQDIDLFFAIAVSSVRALKCVHEQNVIHRDIHPRNILWSSKTRELKLIDFSIASELSRERQGVDSAEGLEGSLPYVSPEQTGRMNRDTDYRSDYYSLGVTFFELLTGTLPFSASDTMGWVHSHISKRPPNPSDLNPTIPQALSQIVVKLMAKDPDDRYQSAHGLLRDLERCEREWRETGTISMFPLGEHDAPERFRISEKLFGREEDVAALRRLFEASSEGFAKLLLVSGYSGAGKSALIQEIHRPVVARRGKFISGKFEQLERNIPYGAILQAVRALVRQLLAEPDDRLGAWKETIGAALHPNGAVLVALIPELERIVGPQPPVPEVSTREAHVRLLRVFGDLIRAVAKPDHPLVLFIDDLQWADASTPELLVHLIADSAIRHLLVIGAYRDNEVQPGDALLMALGGLKERRPEAIHRIELAPLSEESVNDLVADTLRCDPAVSRPLAELVTEKTAGNPFFVKEMLGMFSRAGVFRFSADEGRWHWDFEKIRAASVSDNVVDLLVQRLRRLPHETIECLRLAACIGAQFELQTLARATQRNAGVLAAALWAAVQEGILVPLGDSYRLVREGHDYDDSGLTTLAVRYRFQHDRVQQAAYSLLDASERARTHLMIGRHLLGSGVDEQSERLFEVVDHMNLGRELVTDHAGRAELARLNQVAGLNARRSVAYAIAAAYFESSLGLLSEEEWKSDLRRRFDCRLGRVECLYSSGQIARADALCEELVASAYDRNSGTAANAMKACIQDHQGRFLEAIETIRNGLRLLDFELPADPDEINRKIGEGIGRMQQHLARTPIENLARLPRMKDEDKIATMNLLFQLVPPAIQGYPPLFILAELMMFDLALTHGTTAVSCKNFADCGIVQGGILGDYDRAYRLGQAAFDLLKDYAPTPLECSVHFVFANFIAHWRANHREGDAHFRIAERKGPETGDVKHTAYALALHAQRLLHVGTALDEALKFSDDAAAYLKQVHAVGGLQGVDVPRRAFAQLRGTPEEMASEEAFTQRMLSTNNAQWLYSYGVSQLVVNFLLSDFPAAERWAAFVQPFLPSGGSLFSFPDYHLFHALLLAKKLPALPEAERPGVLENLAATQQKLKVWAENSPSNFAHKFKLLSAELARLRGAPLEEVIGLYDEALTAAGNDFVHLRALILELHADFWTDRKHPHVARSFVQEAYYLYQRWGAQTKLRQLERRHPWLAGSLSAASSLTLAHGETKLVVAGALDLASIVKATQAVSGEMKPDRLFAKLMATIIENAGAQRGCLILKDDAIDELFVEAMAQVDGEVRESHPRCRLDLSADLCPDVVRYVARTSDTVVVDDALHSESYRDDVYIRKNGVKSLLCMPVLNQGRLLAILYAENNVATHAFTSERLKLLQIIASQAAISITNARLYDRLEDKVNERTRELTEKNREVAAMLNSMQQGVFTIDENLVIQPQYSAHLEQLVGAPRIAGADCVRLLFADSSVGDHACAAMRAALQFSFGTSQFLAEMNWVHLVKEFHRTDSSGATRHFEVEWNPIVGETDEVFKILVVLRDVTLLKQLQHTVAQNARELDIVGQILDAGIDGWARFSESSHAFIDENLAILRSDAALGPQTLKLLFRNMHTIKGNARMLGLSHLVDVIHAAEHAYEELGERADSVLDKEKLADGARAVQSALAEYEDVCRRKLGDVTTAQGTRQGQALRGIESAVHDAAAGRIASSEALSKVERLLSRAAAVPLRDVVKECARALPSLARELDKPAPAVECADLALELTAPWAQVMRDVLVHALRNSVDHGIETAAERDTKGKPPQGRIGIACSRNSGHGVVIRVSDDGRGLRVDALREKSKSEGRTDEDVADRVFAQGVSTAARVSAVSGRGVGMEAIRSFMRRSGGEARIRFTGAPADGCRPFELLLDLPEGAIVAAE
ncbi:MAG TPA: AAA family ATPase [Polyangiaceae bacterium]|nr:AAA family ATPase [Polyangiaceae bacterium]